MNIPIRALAVDDNSAWLGQIESALKDCGYEVDTASDYEGALSLIQDKFYHFVATDLALDPRDDSNRDGMILIGNLWRLQEGTIYVALSAYGKMKEGKEATALGALSVIDKDPTLRSQLKELGTRNREQQLLELRRVHHYGVEFLSATEAAYLWSDRALRVLKPKEGYDTLDKLVTEILRGLGPLLYLRNDPVAKIDEATGIITGTYWSKMLVAPISLKLGKAADIGEENASHRNSPQQFQEQGLANIRFKEMHNVAGIVYRCEAPIRTAFQRQLSG